jgi:hypothetical protein
MDDADRVSALLSINMECNPLIQQFLTLLEDPAAHVSAAVLTQAVVSKVLEDVVGRGPLRDEQRLATGTGVSLATDARDGALQRRAYFCNSALKPRLAGGPHAPVLPPRAAPPVPAPSALTPGPLSEQELMEAQRMRAAAASLADRIMDAADMDSDGDPEEGWMGTGPLPCDGCEDGADGVSSGAASEADDLDDLALDPLPAPQRAAPSAPIPLLTRPDGTPVRGGGAGRISGEAGLSPFLFPEGTGYFQYSKRGPKLTDYLLYRFSCPFTMFTLYMPYIMYMFAIRQQHVLAGHVQEQVLLRDIHKERKKHPEASTEDILRNIIRHRVPPCMPGSPQYFQSSLRDLVCMVEHHGLPHLFLTLTEDEVSTTAWPQFDNLEECLDR